MKHTAKVDIILLSCKLTPKNLKSYKKKWVNEPSQVHGIIYREAFGESCNNVNVVGEGFGIMNGEFLTKSFVFNSSNDDYHNDSWEMHAHSTKCVRKVVEWWKKAGSNYLDCPNHSVKSLLSSDNDLNYTAGMENVWVLISTFDRMRQGLYVLFVWNDPFKDLKLFPHVVW